MHRISFISRNALLATLVLIMSSNLLLRPEIAQAQDNNLIARIQRFFFGSRPRGTATGRNRGGAVRDRCPNIQPPLTALVPATSDGIPFIEKTIQDRPAFWFHIPFSPTFSREAEFVIIDEDEKDIYSTKFPLTQQPGIMRLQLPSRMPALQEGKRYRWVFSVMCNPANRSGDATVNGWVQRIPKNLQLNQQLEKVSGLNQSSIYAEAELWHEMFNSLAEFQQANPQNPLIQSIWKETLKESGLPSPAAGKWGNYLLQ
jgi:hypothetical protein